MTIDEERYWNNEFSDVELGALADNGLQLIVESGWRNIKNQFAEHDERQWRENNTDDQW